MPESAAGEAVDSPAGWRLVAESEHTEVPIQAVGEANLLGAVELAGVLAGVSWRWMRFGRGSRPAWRGVALRHFDLHRSERGSGAWSRGHFCGLQEVDARCPPSDRTRPDGASTGSATLARLTGRCGVGNLGDL